MGFADYEKKKCELQQGIAQLKEIASELGYSSEADKLTEIEGGLAKDRFSLVVVGEFSRGKSTFVNALLGKNILPASKNPTTTVLSKIVYADRPYYLIRYKDGSVKEIDEAAFKAIKAQNERTGLLGRTADAIRAKLHSTLQGGVDLGIDDEVDKISFVEVGYPLAFCRHKVDLIDTPGTNDVNVSRSEITYNFLSEAEGAILIMAANQPLSATEKMFIEEKVVGNQIDNFFVVLNYKDDLHNEGDAERVIRHVQDNLPPRTEGNKIYLVSSRQALLYRKQEGGEPLTPKQQLALPASFAETGFPELEKALEYFLAEEKGRAKLHKYQSQVLLNGSAIANNLLLRKEAIMHSSDELKELLKQEQPKYEQMKRDTERIMDYLRIRLQGYSAELAARAERAVQRMINAALAEVNKIDGDTTEEELQTQMRLAVKKVQEDFILEVQGFRDENVKPACEEAVRRLKKSWQDIGSSSMPAFELSMAKLEVSLNMGASSQSAFEQGLETFLGAGLVMALIGFHFVSVFTLALGVLSFFNAGGFEDRRAKLRAEVRKQYGEKLRDFPQRVTDNFEKLIDSVYRKMNEEVAAKAAEAEKQLRDLIATLEGSEKEAAAARSRLSELEQKLQQINEGVRSLV